MFWIEIINVFIWLWCTYQTLVKKQAFKPTPLLLPWGIFVSGDGVIIGLFWIILFRLAVFGMKSAYVGLGICLFWCIRSGGEVVYWLLEQFAVNHRNKPESLFGHTLFPGESIWFVYQIVHQCILVLAILGAVFFAKQI